MIPFGVGVRTAVRRFEAVVDRLNPVVALRGATAALLLGLIPLVPAATPTPAPALPASVWIVAHQDLFRIDPATNLVIESVPLPHEASAAAVDTGRGHLWVLMHRRLLRLDNTTNINLEIDLKDLAPGLDDPNALQVDPYDGSLWIAAKKRLIHLDAQGQLLRSWHADDRLQGFALGLDQSAWLITKRSLTHLSAQADVIGTFRLGEAGGDPHHLAVDSIGGHLWVAGGRDLLLYQLNDPGQAPQRVELPGRHGDRHDHEDEIAAIALNPFTGVLAVAAKSEVLLFDRTGSRLASVDLANEHIHEPEALVFDAASQSYWLGGHKRILRIGSGGEILASIAWRNELEAIGTAAPGILPLLTLLEPGPGVLTNNALRPVRLQTAAQCTSGPCQPGQVYFDGVTVSATLNGKAIGSAFVLAGDAATYQPKSRLPEGKNTLSALVTDSFGHSSNSVESEFTVDTIAPRFLTVTPVNQSTVTAQPVTLRGTVDDASAVVTLENLAGLGGTTMPASPGEFAFELPLAAGVNTFKLTAQDPAGNRAAQQVVITLASPSLGAQVTNLAPGSAIAADSILVSGTYQGPANTGIIVNGVLAELFGDKFYANNVPLEPGGNTIAVKTSSIDAGPVTSSFTIQSTAQSSVTVDRVPVRTASVRTIAGNGVAGYGGDGGQASTTGLEYPQAVALDGKGGLYIADSWHIRHINAAGVITTIAGLGQDVWQEGDGGPALQAELFNPKRLVPAPDGSLYVLDGNRLRHIDANGIIRTVAGSKAPGYSGDGGPAMSARFWDPRGVVIGPDGSIYIADSANFCVRRIDPAGTVTTIAGTPESDGYSGDGGPATMAQFRYPGALALGADGGLYVADSWSGVVRRIDPTGIITTVAGTGNWGNSGDGGPATQALLSTPIDLLSGPDGGLYILDIDYGVVRRVDTNGTISTVAGTGEYGYGGDGGSPLAATFAWPSSFALAADGTMYIADSDNYRVRAFSVVLPSGDASPYMASFRLSVRNITVTRIDADFNGGGTTDFTAGDPNAVLQHTYPGPGVYPARFVVTDNTGQGHVAIYMVVIRDVSAADSMLRETYAQMLARLKAGNLDSALNAFTGGVRDKYRSIFLTLQPELPAIVDRLGTLREGVIGEELAEYILSREVNGTRQGFLMYLLRSEDGVWRIDGM